MRKTPPIKIIVHYPQTRQGKQELAQRLADVHADAVVSTINKLDCPPDVKIGTTNFCKKNVSASQNSVLDNRKGPAKAGPLGYSCSKQLRM